MDKDLMTLKSELKEVLFAWMKSQNDYLDDSSHIPFLKFGDRPDLDVQAPQLITIFLLIK